MKLRLPEKVLKAVMETGSSHNENFLKHKDGSAIWIYDECIYAKEENGKEHIVNFIKDLNREKKFEQKLIEKNEAQGKILKDHEIFIYTTSHDLLSPVKNIESMVGSLEESCDDPEEVEFLVSLIRESVERLSYKIGELSVILKEQEPENNGDSNISFEDLFNDVLLDLEKEIRGSEVEILFDFSKAPTIDFSKKNLESVLQNLVSNSIKYRFTGRRVKINVNKEDWR